MGVVMSNTVNGLKGLVMNEKRHNRRSEHMRESRTEVGGERRGWTRVNGANKPVSESHCWTSVNSCPAT